MRNWAWKSSNKTSFAKKKKKRGWGRLDLVNGLYLPTLVLDDSYMGVCFTLTCFMHYFFGVYVLFHKKKDPDPRRKFSLGVKF